MGEVISGVVWGILDHPGTVFDRVAVTNVLGPHEISMSNT